MVDKNFLQWNKKTIDFPSSLFFGIKKDMKSWDGIVESELERGLEAIRGQQKSLKVVVDLHDIIKIFISS